MTCLILDRTSELCDLQQLGLALVDQATQLPLAHALDEGGRNNMRTFAEFLNPMRERLRPLIAKPQRSSMRVPHRS